jgi:phage baseplate assembly protein W
MAADAQSFLPADDEFAPEPDEELDALEASFDAEPEPLGDDDEGISVRLADEPPVLGRAWAFDFSSNTSLPPGARGPVAIYGMATLRLWIEKCLYTERGSHPIHPPDYGVEGLLDMIAEPATVAVASDLEERIRDALLFHPRISDVRDFDAFVGTPENDDEDVLYVSFTVVTDEGEDESFDALALGVA